MTKDLKEALEDLRKIQNERQEKVLEVEEKEKSKVEILEKNNEDLNRKNVFLSESLDFYKINLEQKLLENERLLNTAKFYQKETLRINSDLNEKLSKQSQSNVKNNKVSLLVKVLLLIQSLLILVTITGAYVLQRESKNRGNIISFQEDEMKILEGKKQKVERNFHVLYQLAIEISKSLKECDSRLKNCTKETNRKKRKAPSKNLHIPLRPNPKKKKSKVWVQLCSNNDPIGCLGKIKNERDM